MPFSEKIAALFGDRDYYLEDAVRVAAGDPLEPRSQVATELPNLRTKHPGLSSAELCYAQHMAAREGAFLHIFGPTDPPNKILSPSDPQLLVNWPGGGIHRWHTDGTFVFATHGLAQPDNCEERVQDPANAWSGMGLEYLIKTTFDSSWPIDVLLHLVKYELFQNKHDSFTVGSTMPVNLGQGISHFFGSYDAELPHQIVLPAGRCTLVHLVGITLGEFEALRSIDDRAVGAGALVRSLRHFGVGATTAVGRGCITDLPGFSEFWATAVDEIHN